MGLNYFIRRATAFTRAVPVAFTLVLAGGAQATDLDTAIPALMDEHKLAGFSVAVMDNYQPVYSGAFGVRQVGQDAAVDDRTAFSAASISKAVTGLVAVMLAEQGVVDLDAPVSSYLKRWQLPASDFTSDTPITLRHLLTHTAGTSQGGFADYFPGEDIPTLIESLNGQKLARYKEPIEVMWQPGSRFKYSGGGFVIAQVALEDVTGKSLAILAEDMLFRPLGMNNTTMRQNGEPGFLANVASAHMEDLSLAGPGGVPIYPQTAASGMWTTPGDMLRLVGEIQRALAGRETKVVSASAARTVTKIQTLLKTSGWSLGWMRYEKYGNLDWFSHSGFNTGIGGLVLATMEDGRAIALFGNGAPRARLPVIDAVIEAVIEDRGWYKPLEAHSEVPTEVADAMVGHYHNINNGYFSPFHELVTIFRDGDRLMADDSLGLRPAKELVHLGKGRFRWDLFRGNAFGPATRDGKQYVAFFHDDVKGAGPALVRLPVGTVPPFDVARTSSFEAARDAYEAWFRDVPDSYLKHPRYFSRLAAKATEDGAAEVARTFYRLGIHFNPDDETLKAELAKFEIANGR